MIKMSDKEKKYEALSHLICDRGVIYDFNSFHHIDIIKSEFREVLNDVYQRDAVKEPRVDTLSINRCGFHDIDYYIESFPNTDIPDGGRSIYFTIDTAVITLSLKYITNLIDDDRFIVEEYNSEPLMVKIKHKESITMNGDNSGTSTFDLYKECLFECLRVVDRIMLYDSYKHNKFGDYRLEIENDYVCKEVTVGIMIPPNNNMETLTKQIDKIRTIESVNCVSIDIDEKGLCHLVIYSKPLEDYYDYKAISDAINTTIIDDDTFRTSEVYNHFISICKVLKDMIYLGMWV